MAIFHGSILLGIFLTELSIDLDHCFPKFSIEGRNILPDPRIKRAIKLCKLLVSITVYLVLRGSLLGELCVHLHCHCRKIAAIRINCLFQLRGFEGNCLIKFCARIR